MVGIDGQQCDNEGTCCTGGALSLLEHGQIIEGQLFPLLELAAT